jgi:hypothetical protein
MWMHDLPMRLVRRQPDLAPGLGLRRKGMFCCASVKSCLAPLLPFDALGEPCDRLTGFDDVGRQHPA